MEKKVRSLADVRKEKWLEQVRRARELGQTALTNIDEALEQNAEVIEFPKKPEDPGDPAA